MITGSLSRYRSNISGLERLQPSTNLVKYLVVQLLVVQLLNRSGNSVLS